MSGVQRHSETPSSSEIDSALEDLPRMGFKLVEVKQKSQKIKRLRNYVMGDVLGRGSFAKVREAIDTDSGQLVSIKIFRLDQVDKIPGGHESMETELQLANTLHHPHIVDTYGTFDEPAKGKRYLVMEYCGGGTVQNLLQQSPKQRLPRWQARLVVRQLVEALVYLHGEGVIHGDIKPANMLLTADGVLKLCDFGSAHRANGPLGNNNPELSFSSSVLEEEDDITSSGVVHGAQKPLSSPLFAAPEYLNESQAPRQGKSDVWGVGVLMFNLLTGRYPFSGETVTQVYDNVVGQDIVVDDDPLLDVDSQLLLKGILCRNVSRRWSAAQLLRQDWLQIPAADDDHHHHHIPAGGPAASAAAAAGVVGGGGGKSGGYVVMDDLNSSNPTSLRRRKGKRKPSSKRSKGGGDRSGGSSSPSSPGASSPRSRLPVVPRESWLEKNWMYGAASPRKASARSRRPAKKKACVPGCSIM